MTLKAVVLPQTQDPSFGYGINKDYFYNYNLLGGGAGNWSYEDLRNFEREQDQQQGSISFLENQTENDNYPYGDWNNNNNNNNPLLSAESNNDLCNNQNFESSNSTTASRPKRRRAKSKKNKEQIENQRMTHIAVERNRRKQMNEYLSVLRSLMPDSYVQRGDQASIVGGAINFVKELEQRMQFLGSHQNQKKSDVDGGSRAFFEFFTFPQYSTISANSTNGCDIMNSSSSVGIGEHEVHSSIADIEVTMVECHANLKIRSKKRPKQLLQIVSGLHNMSLTILHLNVTTTVEIVLYSLSVKVEDDCKLGSVDDIAAAVYQLMDRIEQEEMLN